MAIALGLAVPARLWAQAPAGDSPPGGRRPPAFAARAAGAPDSARANPFGLSPQRLPRSQPWRGRLELGGLYSGLVAHYFNGGRDPANEDRPASDWQAIFSLSRLRFDDNTFNMNNVGHPIAGSVFYGIPRANGASAVHAFLYLLAADVLWEQAVEYQEVSSINDHVVTLTAGFAMGEALFQDRLFFRRARPTPVNRFLDKLFGFPVDLSEAAVRRPAPPRANQLGPSGLPADITHRFRLFVGASDRRDTFDGSGAYLDLGLESQLLNVGWPEGEGTRQGWLGDVAASEGDLTLSFQRGKIKEGKWFAGVVPMGWVHQRFHDAAVGPGRGALFLVGPSVAWDIDIRGAYGSWYQRYASALLGLSSRAELVGRAGAASMAVDAWANFSSISPYTARYGYPDSLMTHDATALRNGGYYYAVGPSLRGRLVLGRGPFELTGTALQHRFFSLSFRDREPTVATQITPKWDHWTTAHLRLAWRAAPGLELAAGLERAWWRAAIAAHTGRATEQGWDVRVSAVP